MLPGVDGDLLAALVLLPHSGLISLTLNHSENGRR